MPGVVSVPHGWGHGRPGVKLQVATAHPGASINDLTDDQAVDALLGTAAFVAGLIIGRASDGTLTNYGWVGWLSAACTLLAIVLAWRILVIPDGSHAPD